MMKIKSTKWLVTGVIATAVFALPLYANALTSLGKATPAYAADSSSAQLQHVITVNGEGDITVQPDIAYVNLGIQTKDETANGAQKKNAEEFAKLETLLYDTYKLDKKDVKTSGFNVYPDYSYTDNSPKIIGYTASQTITVSYRDLSNLGTFLDDASNAGVNMVNGIQFSTEKGKEYELQVIEKAMANAEEKAKVIAKYAGKELKGIVSVSQNGATPVPVQYANYAVPMAKQAAMDAAGTSISAGDMKVTTSVTVTFEF